MRAHHIRSALVLLSALVLVVFTGMSHAKSPPNGNITFAGSNLYSNVVSIDPGGGSADIANHFAVNDVISDEGDNTACGVPREPTYGPARTTCVLTSGASPFRAAGSSYIVYACATTDDGSATRSSEARRTMARHHTGKSAGLTSTYIAWASGALQRT